MVSKRMLGYMTMAAGILSLCESMGITGDMKGSYPKLKCESPTKQVCPVCGNKGVRERMVCSKECLIKLRSR